PHAALSLMAPLAAAVLAVLAFTGAVSRWAPGEHGPAAASVAGAPAGEIERGLLAVLLCPQPRRVAILGLGDGVAAGRIAAFSEIERLDCVEPDAAVVAAARSRSKQD